MDQPSQNENLLLALAGSTIFWSVLAGMAMKTLKRDSKELECFLKDVYERADRFTFSATEIYKVAALATLRALYGKQLRRILLTSLATSVALNAYVFSLFYIDWSHRKLEVTAIEHRAIAEVSPEYFQLIMSSTGRERLGRALDQVVSQGGGPSLHKQWSRRYPHTRTIRAIYG